ncbi:MAG: glycoside hydrolase N-terminal domain-containing protein, partial [Rubripirellula sp.]
YSDQPAARWQEALVTGNGTMGAMVFGVPAQERIVLNHERLYEPLLDVPCPVPDISAALPETRRLLMAGLYKEAYAYAYQAAIDAGFPGIQWTDPYHPACSLLIDQDTGTQNATTHETDSGVTHYWRSTDFETGEVAVHWRSGGRDFVRQTFVSRPDQVIVIRISAADGKPVAGNIKLVNQDSRPRNKRVDEKGGGYRNPVIAATDDSLSYRCKYQRSDRGYQTLVRVVTKGGTSTIAEQADAAVHFDAAEVVLLVKVESLEKFDEAGESLAELGRSLAAINADYDQGLRRHADVHGEMFRRVDLQLGAVSVDEVSLSAESLISLQKQTADEKIQPALLQKMFDMGRYTLISSSGEWPPNLMSIWNGNWRPEWSGDFTLDANVNLQIAAANLGNLPEAIRSYDRLVLGLVDDWKTNATNLFGCRGVLSGSRTDGRHNLHTHFSKTFPGHAWTAGAEWMVLPMWEHYETTGDDVYLRDHLLPIMKEIAAFYDSFLQVRDDDGHRVFVPSYSPENRPLNTGCAVAINATMDIACAKESLRHLLDLKSKSSLSAEQISAYEKMLNELPPYLIADDVALKEW